MHAAAPHHGLLRKRAQPLVVAFFQGLHAKHVIIFTLLIRVSRICRCRPGRRAGRGIAHPRQGGAEEAGRRAVGCWLPRLGLRLLRLLLLGLLGLLLLLGRRAVIIIAAVLKRGREGEIAFAPLSQLQLLLRLLQLRRLLQ